MKSKLIILNIALLVLYLSPLFLAVNICPPDKARTEITIEHSRHPQNIPLGITDNTIDVTITLNAIDKQTGKKIPLANKEVLIELVIGSKFIARNQDGSFTLSDQSSPFPLNTSQNGTISFTIYTQPPLLENPTDPRKISYSITASFTPKPKEPLMGSSKTEKYVPGVFPIISMAACAPLFIIFALLIAAMFAAGKNPFGLFDFSRVSFKAPAIPAGRVTPRVKTTLVGAAVGAAQQGLTVAAKTGLYQLYKQGKKAEAKKKGELKATEKQMAESKGLAKVGNTASKWVGAVLSAPFVLSGRILMTGASRRLSAEEQEKLKKAQQETGKPISKEEAEKILNKKGRIIIGPLGEIRIIESDAKEKFSLRDLTKIFSDAFRQKIGGLGTRPWSLAYAYPIQVKKPSNETYTKGEQEEIKKKVEEYTDGNVKLDKNDVDTYGLTDSGKMKILEALGKTDTLNQLKDLKEILQKGSISPEFTKAAAIIESLKQELEGRLSSPYLTPLEKSEIKSQIKMLSAEDVNTLIKNVDKLHNKEFDDLASRIKSNGALIGFDKKDLINEQRIDAKNYYKNYAVDELKSRLGGDAGLLAEAYGIPLKELANAYDKNDIQTVNKILKDTLNQIKNEPESLAAFNYLTKEIQVGAVMKYIDKMEIKDENGKPITKIDDKVNKFLDVQPETKVLTKNIIETLKSEGNIDKSLEKAVKIVLGPNADVSNIENLTKTVIDGENIVKQKMNELQNELKELQKEYPSPTPNSIGEEKIKQKEKEIENTRIDLLRVQDGISKINAERENLLLSKEVYNIVKEQNLDNVVPGLSSISKPTHEALFNLYAIRDAVANKNAEESTKENMIPAVMESQRKIETIPDKIQEFYDSLPPIPMKINDVDRLAMKIAEEMKEGYKKAKTPLEEIMPKELGKPEKTFEQLINEIVFTTSTINSNRDAFDPEKRNQIKEAIKEVENMQKVFEDKQKEVAITQEEKNSAKGYYEKLEQIRKTLEESRDTLEKGIDKYVNEQRDNPYNTIIDTISYSSIIEGKTAEELKGKLDKNSDASVIAYYKGKTPDQLAKENDPLAKEANEELDEWTKKFYGGVRKEGVTKVEITPAAQPTEFKIEKSNEKDKSKKTK
jgi:hypothetical protein